MVFDAMTGAAKLIVFAGLPGTGKSTVARGVAEELGAVWLRVDTFEASMLKAGLRRSFETGLAAYLAARDVAADQLRTGRSVVIDAVNGVEPGRQLWRDLERAAGVRRYTIEMTCADIEEHRRRIEGRGDPTPPLPMLTWEDVVTREYEPWTEPVLSLDGRRSPEENIRRVVDHCR